MFSFKVKTVKRMKLVRDYQDTHDVQKDHQELKEHCLKSPTAKSECTATAAFLLKARMEEWPGLSFDFIAHMLSQIKDHNQKADAPCTDAQKCTFLEDSVQNVPNLPASKVGGG